MQNCKLNNIMSIHVIDQFLNTGDCKLYWYDKFVNCLIVDESNLLQIMKTLTMMHVTYISIFPFEYFSRRRHCKLRSTLVSYQRSYVKPVAKTVQIQCGYWTQQLCTQTRYVHVHVNSCHILYTYY